MIDAGGDLFKFANLDFAKNGTPQLEPPGGSGLAAGNSNNQIAAGSSGFYPIDVVNNFHWTTSPKSSRSDTPTIQLVERRLVTNSLVAQALYNIAAIKNTTGAAATAFSSLDPVVQTALKAAGGATAIDKAVGQLFPESPLTRVITALIGGGAAALTTNETFTQIGTTITNFVEQSIKTIGNLQNDASGLNSAVLLPYEGLYITTPTKFLYTLPYFSDTQNTILNSFQDNDAVFEGGSESTAAPVVEGLTQSILATRGFAQGLARTAFFGAPGIYIEKPKYYNFNNQGESISVRFPLVNTGWATYNDVMRNWQLLFMLTYQNRPNRKSRDLIDPSVLYEINIPGIKYHPFAYIDRLRIRFRGSRRNMKIKIPGPNGSSATVTTIVPDAYDVELTLKTLINESQNTLYSMLFDKNDLITVTEANRLPSSLPVPGGNLPLPDANGRLPVQTSPLIPTPGGRLPVPTSPGTPELSNQIPGPR